MKFNLEDSPGSFRISAYAPGWIRVRNTLIESPCVITPTAIHEDLLPATLEAINASHFDSLLDLAPEIVIMGTGKQQVFIDYNFVQILGRQNVGLEFMDTGAACRSFNILISEGRAIIAALFMI
ncbi:MAG: MTH938/NDUFAF3 family protein [Gammaproteobacteria bacterium]